ncbi:MAG: DUF4041 domain-containing protein [Zoogloeaceae bacterium]|jgi:uncharacterized protein YlxW (UPF0749 family)|nr:DUF4041 domain-containing protein [Zoogloeaceae bacterium]
MTAKSEQKIPLFGARKFARGLLGIIEKLEKQIADLGLLTVLELENKKNELQNEVTALTEKCESLRIQADNAIAEEQARLNEIRSQIVETEELALLQEAGVYRYRHPLNDAVAYKLKLKRIEERIKAAVKKDGGAVSGSTNWTVNGSQAQGRKMVNETSKLMLRAFNAEADNAVQTLKPYKLDAATDRLIKVAATIERLGKTMSISIDYAYLRLRIEELELTADFLQKEAEEKEVERAEKERLREERKAQQEMERERARLEKERQHYENALAALAQKGDEEGAARLREQLGDVQRAIEDVDYRAANIRAGYVYVISNIGSFGEDTVKIGMTRRLDPIDRIRELSDASVPFNFDVHALFFSKDAVSIETAMHQRLADRRINKINQRREFFRATPLEAKAHLAELAGELLQFTDIPEAREYRESITLPSR